MRNIKTAIKSTLIIDHDEKSNKNLIAIFRENGLELEMITNEQNFVNKIESKKYDCVMIKSDLSDDYTSLIIDLLKVHYPWVIVIVLLENPSYEKIFRFMRAGVDDFILKPFTWDDFEKILKFYYF